MALAHDAAMDLRSFREQVGATLEGVADVVGVAASTLSRIERGSIPHADVALRLIQWAEAARVAARLPASARVSLADLANGVDEAGVGG